MAKLKSFEGAFLRWVNGDWYYLSFDENDIETFGLCGPKLRLLTPALTKGIRKGRSAKVKLTQTKKGIKLERI
jgi:hypothetical protein